MKVYLEMKKKINKLNSPIYPGADEFGHYLGNYNLTHFYIDENGNHVRSLKESRDLGGDAHGEHLRAGSYWEI